MRPLRNLVLVERLPEVGHLVNDKGDEVTAGGIIVPQTFKAKGPSQRLGAKRDHFRARVVAVGPDASRDLKPEDEILVWTFAGGAGDAKQGLYTGTPVPGGLLIEYPEDVVCALDVGNVGPNAMSS